MKRTPTVLRMGYFPLKILNILLFLRVSIHSPINNANYNIEQHFLTLSMFYIYNHIIAISVYHLCTAACAVKLLCFNINELSSTLQCAFPSKDRRSTLDED